MTTWQGRERAFEAKFAHDEEFRFLVTARRDKLFAGWAAARFHLSDPAATDLAASVLAVRDGAGHDERLLQHIRRALADHGHDVQPDELMSALDACAAQARQQLLQSPRVSPT
jgi:hypothetical protein